MSKLELYIDGASKGNPGPSGIGVVIRQNGKTIKEIAQYIGDATNNTAEYTALIFALQESLVLGARGVLVRTDSELLYRQIAKVYKVRQAHIAVLYQQAVQLIAHFKDFSIRHIPRTENKEADRLASQAVKDSLKKGLR